jgi:hypothetical protein
MILCLDVPKMTLLTVMMESYRQMTVFLVQLQRRVMGNAVSVLMLVIVSQDVYARMGTVAWGKMRVGMQRLVS